MSCFQAHTRPSVLEALEAALAACGLPLLFVHSFLDESGFTELADLPPITCAEFAECLRGTGVMPMKATSVARRLVAYAKTPGFIALCALPPRHDVLGTASALPELPSPAPAPLSTAAGASAPPRATTASVVVAPSDPCLVSDGLDEAERSTPHSGAPAPTPNNHLDGASSVTSRIGSDAMIEKTGALSPDSPLSSRVKEEYSRCTASAPSQCAAAASAPAGDDAVSPHGLPDGELISPSGAPMPPSPAVIGGVVSRSLAAAAAHSSARPDKAGSMEGYGNEAAHCTPHSDAPVPTPYTHFDGAFSPVKEVYSRCSASAIAGCAAAAALTPPAPVVVGEHALSRLMAAAAAQLSSAPASASEGSDEMAPCALHPGASDVAPACAA